MSSSYRNRIHKLLSHLTIGSHVEIARSRGRRKRGGLFEFLETRQLLSVTTAATTVDHVSHAGINFGNVTFQVTSGTLTDIEFTALPANGTLSFNNTAVTTGQDIPVNQLANLTYTPTAGTGGADVAQWDGSDNGGSTFSGTPANLTLNVNHQPTLQDISISVNHNGQVVIASTQFTGAFSDVDSGDTLQSVTFWTVPAHGTLRFGSSNISAGGTLSLANLSIGTLTYIPNPNYAGADSFQWNASDGLDAAAANANVNFTVQDTAPTLHDVSANVTHGSSHTFTPAEFSEQFNDADSGDTMQSITITSLPGHGNLSLANVTLSNAMINTPITIPQLTNSPLVYTPDASYAGDDSFTWNASDGAVNAAADANVSLHVIDTAPTLSNISITAKPNVAKPITATDFGKGFTDTDTGDTLKSVRIVTTPAHGTLKVGAASVTVGEVLTTAQLANLTYTSTSNNISDSFQWNASDGALFAASNVTVNITVADAAPILSTTGVHVDVGSNATLSSAMFTQAFSDADAGDSIQHLKIVTAPQHGNIEYASNSTIIPAGTTLAFTDLTNLKYAPDGTYTGADAFTWNASDGSLFATSDATFNLSSETAPVLHPVTLSMLINSSHTFSVSDFDPTGNGSGTKGYTDAEHTPLASITVTALPLHGSLTLNGSPVLVNQTIAASDIPNLVYSTNATSDLADFFQWTASDGTLTATTASPFVLVVLDPAATTAGNLTLATSENRSLTIAGSEFNAQFGPQISGLGLPLNYIKIVKNPSHGTLIVNGAPATDGQIYALTDVLYRPNNGYVGADSFTWTGSNDSTHYAATPGTVSLTISVPTETAFTKFVSSTGSTSFTTAEFASNFSGPGNATLARIRINSLPAHGVLKIGSVLIHKGQLITATNLGYVTYTPTTGYVGTDSFLWSGTDGGVFGTPVAVNLNVLPPLAIIGNDQTVPQKARPTTANFTDFGNWVIAADSSMQADTRTFTIRNSSSHPMSFKNIAVGGSNRADFTVSQPTNYAHGGFIVAPGETVTFTVRFNPHGVGVRYGAILLRNTAGAILFQLNLQGTALASRTVRTTSIDAGGNTVHGVVQVVTTKNGSGPGAHNGVIISMSYTGYMANGGTIFDSTSRNGGVPLTFRLDDAYLAGQPFINKDQANVRFSANSTSLSSIDFPVIAGWEYGLQGIRAGEHRTLVINSTAAYGPEGKTDPNTGQVEIPPNSTLIFDVVCEEVAPKPQLEQLEFTTSDGGPASNFTLTNTSNSSSLTHTFLFLPIATVDANGTPLDSWKFTSKITLNGHHQADYTLSGPVQDSSIPSGIDISVTFHPLTTGIKRETLDFSTDDPTHRRVSIQLIGKSSKYSDLSVGFDPTLNLPTQPIITGSGQTMTVPVTVSNSGDATFPGNSKTNIQIYAKNNSTGKLTLVGYVNNIDVSNLQVRGIKRFYPQIALPLDNQSPFSAFPAGIYTFTAVVNRTTRLDNSTVSGLVLLPPNGKFTTMVQGAGDGVTANQTMTDNDTVDTATALIPSRKPVNRGINVVAGQYTLGGSLGASTIVASPSTGAHGVLNVNVQNLGNIYTIPAQVLSVDIIAQPLNGSANITLASNVASAAHIAPGGAMTLSVPVDYAGSQKIASGTYQLIARVSLLDPGHNVLSGPRDIVLDGNLNPVLLNA
ncbi:MAG: cadherin-like domain-containing protein [Phycisphaerae bacterium]